jgi:ATP-dependent RNA helicase RhlE
MQNTNEIIPAPASIIPPLTGSFSDFSLDVEIMKALAELDYRTPTPIQQQTIPIVLQGKDLIGAAQTGTGKTAAFALPILQYLTHNKRWSQSKRPRILVISPTRELTLQIHDNFKQYGKYLRIKSVVIFGGVSQANQVRELSQGTDIVVATPGRLLDLVSQRKIDLTEIETFVLDEADRMLDMGFLPDVKRIIQLLPKKRQNLFFSATMPTEIKRLADSFLVNPILVKVTPISSTAPLINQKILFVDRAKKKELLLWLLKDKALDKVIVFSRTKHGANKLSEVLQKNKILSLAIHGNKSNNARVAALDQLKSGKCRVLVATDIVARGIDIDQISHVINFDIPNESESYVHRIGRTGRAGLTGIALSLCDLEEKSFLSGIEKLIGKPMEIDRDHPFHSDSIENARQMRPGVAKAKIENRSGGRSQRGGGGGSGRRFFRGAGTGKGSGGGRRFGAKT